MPRTLPTFAGPNRTGEIQYNGVPLRIRELTVRRIEQITPLYRRIVVGGPELERPFPWVHFAPADHVKVFFPDPATGVIARPRLTEDGTVAAAEGTPISRDYTVRAVDDEAGELTVDFVLHDHGVAGRWASRAEVGDTLVLGGPRGNKLFPENFPFYLAAGDGTALPAISRLVEELPENARAEVVIEVADAAEIQDLPARPGVRIQWVPRDTSPVHDGDSGPLETALRGIDLPTDAHFFAFVAGEATSIRPIRRRLRRELGLPKGQADVDGYWKRGVSALDHHGQDEDD